MTPAKKIAAKHNAAVKGHNSDPSGSTKSYFDRLLNLEEQKVELASDIRELKAEMKDNDVVPQAIAIVVKRAMEDVEKKAKRLALAETVDQYKAALNLLD